MDKGYFYIIKDEYFDDFPDKFLKGNKEENRPHYYCFKDNKTGLYWIIPLSSRIEKYEKYMKKDQEKYGRSDKFHIVSIAGKTECFLIQDMFPIIPEYIEREYTVNKIPLKLTNKGIAKEISQKASKILALIRKGVKFSPTQPDVLKIEKEILEYLESKDIQETQEQAAPTGAEELTIPKEQSSNGSNLSKSNSFDKKNS
jgi:hypothetical protein